MSVSLCVSQVPKHSSDFNFGTGINFQLNDGKYQFNFGGINSTSNKYFILTMLKSIFTILLTLYLVYMQEIMIRKSHYLCLMIFQSPIHF